jgi:hypothetical protein
MTRDHLNDEEREAMRLLDLWKAGEDIPPAIVDWSLRVTGDSVGLKDFA